MGDETLGARIRQLREDRKLSQDELGERAGVSGQAIWMIEHGRNTPRANTLAGIAAVLNVSRAYLILGDRANAVPDLPPEMVGLYESLSERDRRIWLELGRVLREEQQADLRLVAEEPEDYAAFSEPELAEEARRESEDFDGA